MADSVPRALVFDVGQVIVRLNVNRALATLGASANLSAEQVLSAIRSHPRMRDFQEGRLTPGQWHEELVCGLGLRLPFEQFCEAWNSALEPETILDDDLFAHLATRYRLLLLSNTDPIHIGHLEAHFSFPHQFSARLYSCSVGASKPDAAIYRRAIQEAGVAPERILYIDDNPDFVEAGRRAGMQALLFEGAEQLREVFHRRGILQP